MNEVEVRTFEGRTIAPKEDALIYQTAIPDSGLFYGGDVTYTGGNTLHFASAEGIIRGRKFTLNESSVSVPLPATGSLPGQAYIRVDLGNPDNPGQLIVEAAADLHVLQQDDLFNETGGVYEYQLCTFTAGESMLTDIRKTAREVTVLSPEQLDRSLSGTIFKIPASGWALGSAGLYEYTLNASAVYSPCPEIAISGATVGAQATATEESAYNTLTAAGHYAETSDNTVHLFAKSAPASDFYVMIKGVA